MIFCPECGTKNGDTAKFCFECGTRLPVREASAVPEPAPTVGDSAPQMAPETSSPPTPESDTDSGSPSAPASTSGKDKSGLPPTWMPAPVKLTVQPTGQSTSPAAAPTTELAPESQTTSGTTATSPAARPAKDVSGAPPPWMPAPVDLSAARSGKSPLDDDWKMSDPGPLPVRRGRRLWLWIPIIIIVLVLVFCVAFFLWAQTIGSDTVARWATDAAISATEKASSGGN